MTSNGVTPQRRTARQYTWQTLIEFDLSREPGSEHLAVERVAEAVQRLNWPAAQLGQLKLALARAAGKAVAPDCHYDAEAPLVIRVLIPENDPGAQEAERTGGELTEHQVAERQAQQVGQPPSRGWGFFLIQRQQDDLQALAGGSQQVIELFLYQER